MTTQVSKQLVKTFSLKSLGAKGDGSTDDTAAVRSALLEAGANGWTIRNDPGDVYYFASDLEIENVDVFLEGGTFLFATDTGMSISHASPFQYVRIKDITFETTGSSDATALTIENTNALDGNRATFPTVELSNIRVGDPRTYAASETTAGNTFLGGIKLIDCDTPILRDISIRGLRDGNFAVSEEAHWYRTDSFGVFLDSPNDRQPTLTHIYGLDVKSVRTALKVRGNMEGIYVFGGALIQVGTGCTIDWVGAQTINPGFQTFGTHISAVRQCYDLYGVYDFTISGGHYYRFDRPHGVNWVGVRMDDCSRGTISGGQWTGANNDPDAGIVRLGEWTNSYRIYFQGACRRMDENIRLYGSSSRDNRVEIIDESDVAPILYSSGATAGAQLGGEGAVATNSGAVAIGSLSNVVTVPVDASNGQIIDIYAEYRFTKGGTAGNTTISISESGGNALFLTGSNTAVTYPNTAANSTIRGVIHCRCKVSNTAPSTLTFILNAESGGSNATFSAGDTGIRVVRN